MKWQAETLELNNEDVKGQFSSLMLLLRLLLQIQSKREKKNENKIISFKCESNCLQELFSILHPFGALLLRSTPPSQHTKSHENEMDRTDLSENYFV